MNAARPTPCGEWTLGDLLTHMSVQHRGFAAAAEGNGADRSAWRPRPAAGDPVAEYAAAADRVLRAFGVPAPRDAGQLDRFVALLGRRPDWRPPA